MMAKPNMWAVVRVSIENPKVSVPTYRCANGKWLSLIPISCTGEYVTADRPKAIIRVNHMNDGHKVVGENEYYLVDFYFEEET